MLPDDGQLTEDIDDFVARAGNFPRSRSAVHDHEHVVRRCREFCVDVGERVSADAIDAGSWEDIRSADRHFTFWETPDGVRVSMAGSPSTPVAWSGWTPSTPRPPSGAAVTRVP